MKLLNKNGLPQAVFEWIKNDPYSKGDADISVSELCDSPRIRCLKKEHDHEIEMEADSLLAANLGKALHSAIEAGTKTGVTERRLSIARLGWKISGAMDHFHDGVLTDYKTANIFKTMHADDGKLTEWEQQTNCYAHILRCNEIEVNKIKIFVLFKDWNSWGYSKAAKENAIFVPNERKGYPERHWLYFNLPLWTPSVAENFIQTRINLHQRSETELASCTSEDVWLKNGKAGRCEKYCSVSQWCKQYQASKTTGRITKE